MMEPRRNAANTEIMMANRRREETKLKVLTDYTGETTRLEIAAKSEIAIPQRRRAAQTLKLQTEAQIQALQERRASAQRRHELDVAQSQRLAAELERRKADAERKEREVQRICDESEELKQLELKLKVAYMNKERAAQHEERILQQRRERLREKAIDDQMECDRRAAIEAEQSKSGSKHNVAARQKAALQAQMEDRKKLKEEALLEAQRDKDMVEAVVEKIIAEDAAEIAERNKRKDECRLLIKQYEVQRKAEVEEARERAAFEEAEILNYGRALAAREAELARLKLEKKARDKAAFDKIVQETERARASEDEIARLRDLLWEEEMEAQRRKEDEERAAKVAAAKREMQRQNEMSLALKKEQQLRDEAEEQRLVEIMQRKFMEDEANEQRLADARAGAKARYIEQVKQQTKERQELYERVKAAELAEQADDGQDESYRLKVVQEARRRLLAEHADALRGFLPKGTIRGDDDFQFS